MESESLEAAPFAPRKKDVVRGLLAAEHLGAR